MYKSFVSWLVHTFIVIAKLLVDARMFDGTIFSFRTTSSTYGTEWPFLC